MYNPTAFAERDIEQLYRFIRERPLAILVAIQEGAPSASHLPMFLDAGKQTLRAHMAKANKQWQYLDGARVLAIFLGPEHYVTPSWYPSKRETGRVVPTWNYLTVHVEGTARLFDDHDAILRHLNELTVHNEALIESGWQVADAPEKFIDGLAQTIIGVEISIEAIEGKWKINQNRSAQDRKGVIEGLESGGTSAALEMADLMKRRETS